MNLNKAFVLGNLTRDPERRSLPSGDPVANFTVATNRHFTSKGEKREETEFHNIVLFGKLAETATQYLKKGSMVLIEGRIQTRTWDSQDGQKHYKTEVIGERMQLGPRRTNQSSSETPIPSPQVETPKKEENIPVIQEDEPTAKDEIDVKDIPF